MGNFKKHLGTDRCAENNAKAVATTLVEGVQRVVSRQMTLEQCHGAYAKECEAWYSVGSESVRRGRSRRAPPRRRRKRRRRATAAL
jgi:hypothetical protein